MAKQLPSTTLAVLRATPRSVRRSSMVRGTSPPNRSQIVVIDSCTARALLRQKFRLRTKGSISAGLACA
jgi:hypothetical protein